MNRFKNYFYILLLGSVLFFPFLGNSHLFDWDEINFAEASREMVLTGNYTQTQIDFQEFWEKPPFFFWMQALSMKLFGVNEYAARFPNAICGILTLLILFKIGTKLKDTKFGWLWVLCYAGSILPQFYFKSGIIDPWFNLFIFLSIYYFICYLREHFRIKFLFLSAFMIGLAILTKGPVAIFILGLTVGIYYLINRFRLFPPFLHIVYYLFFIALTIFPWIGIEIAQNGTWFITEFMRYTFRLATTEDASHGGFFGYHFVVILFFCFPASVFAIRALFKKQTAEEQIIKFRQWMLILFWVVMILFSIVQTKIAHYSSMAYFPLTFLSALTLYALKDQWRKWESLTLLFIGSVIIILISGIPYVLQNPELISPYIKDSFTKDALNANGNWSGWESLIAIILVVGIGVSMYFIINKKVNKAIIILFGSSIIIINLALNTITPKIERYSQGAMVDFLVEKSREDCYLDVIGYKSYAHLFYGARKPEDNKNEAFLSWLEVHHPNTKEDPIAMRKYFSEWLLLGNTDKPVYFVTNVRKAENYKDQPQLIFLEQKNGFVFFKKEIEQ